MQHQIVELPKMMHACKLTELHLFKLFLLVTAYPTPPPFTVVLLLIAYLNLAVESIKFLLSCDNYTYCLNVRCMSYKKVYK